MADSKLLIPEEISSWLQLAAAAVGVGGGLKVIGSIVNKYMDRKMKTDEFVARDGSDFIRYMQDTIKDLRTEVDVLTKRVEDKTQSELILRIELSELKNEMARLRADNDRLTVDNNTLLPLKGQVHRLSQQVKDLQSEDLSDLTNDTRTS